MLCARHWMRFGVMAILVLGSVACSTSTAIRTDPPGATIFIDGQEVGKSPLNYNFSGLAWNQSYEVRCVLEGYEVEIEKVWRQQKGFLGMGTDWPESILVRLKSKR